ncbi:MAG: hypothetical protein NW217_16020 [Hyphomicrobiaceae bacterium]|nr:hypothetical protein [Hyphomicrobiaceae bacterium]
MIDANQSRDFPTFCKHLSAAKLEQATLVNRGLAADAHLERMRRDALGFLESLGEIQQTYSAEDIACLRRTKSVPDSMLEQLERNVLLLAGFMLRSHRKVKRRPPLCEFHNTFIFRYALCMQLYVIDWIADGSTPQIGSGKTVNHKVDLIIAAYGTFFDGVLTNDKMLLRVFNQADAALRNLLGD